MPLAAKGYAAGFTAADKPLLPVADDHRALAVDRQSADEGSVLAFFRALLQWRRERPWLRTAHETMHDAQLAPLVAFERHDGDHRLTFVANVSLDRRFFATDRWIEPLAHSAATAGEKGIDLPWLGFAVLAPQLWCKRVRGLVPAPPRAEPGLVAAWRAGKSNGSGGSLCRSAIDATSQYWPWCFWWLWESESWLSRRHGYGACSTGRATLPKPALPISRTGASCWSPAIPRPAMSSGTSRPFKF